MNQNSRWAVKEALYKAFGAWRIDFTQIQLTKETARAPLLTVSKSHLPPQLAQATKPKIALYGQAKNLANALGVTQIHVSLSHDTEYAVAHVMLAMDANPEMGQPPQ